MEYYSRMATPKLKRITIRFSFIEIELRARPKPARDPERISKAECAYRWEQAEHTIRSFRYSVEAKRVMGW